MAQRIVIPEDEITKLFEEVDNMTEEQLKELGEVYQRRLAMQGGASGDPEKRRLANAIRRKKMKMVVDRALEQGLIPQRSRKELHGNTQDHS